MMNRKLLHSPIVHGLACLLMLTGLLPVNGAPPKILLQSGSYEVREGDCFESYVTVHGDALTYQWYQGDEPLVGQTEETLVLETVGVDDAGGYSVIITNVDGFVRSEQVRLSIVPTLDFGITPSNKGTVLIPGSLAYYDLYLPSSYGEEGRVFPILFTFNPSGGGMVNHFRKVAEEKQWIIVGIPQSQNGQYFFTKGFLNWSILRHALSNLKVDPGRVFTAGTSGGGWNAFESAKYNAPIITGVFSMAGWLGDKYSATRDMYLPGLLVARAYGETDHAADNLEPDRNHLERWLEPGDIEDWSFPGGHVSAPESIQREVFDWFDARVKPSSSEKLDQALKVKAHWMARITAGDGSAVFEEVVQVAFDSPRNPEALAAWQTMDYLFSRYDLFMQTRPPNFESFARKDFFRLHLYYNLYTFLQLSDPSRQMSATAALLPTGSLDRDPFSRFNESHILRHRPHTAFETYILENNLYDRDELPYAGDWDGDGMGNFSEFTLGTNPLEADTLLSAHLEAYEGTLFAASPQSGGGALIALSPMVSDDLSENSWLPAPLSDVWSRIDADGKTTVTYQMADTLSTARQFVRFESAPWSDYWEDANQDGIQNRYHFSASYINDSPSHPDVRKETSVPGGAPLYLKYLTAANIGRVNDFTEESFRYHPALAGYRGYLYHEVWMGVSGTSVSGARYAMHSREPSHVRLMTTSQAVWFGESGVDILGSNYMERTRGYVVPSVSGNYTFGISGDDQCELWLSTDDHPGRAIKIAYVSSYSGYQNYTKSGNQTSVTIPLDAGSSYYIEILHKEGGGDGHCAVAWTTPANTTLKIIPSENLRCLPASYIGADSQWQREVWENMSGSDLSPLKSAIASGQAPHYVRPMSMSEVPSDIGNSYGTRIRGMIVAPETADYTFWVASDDQSEVYLSTSADPAAKQLIASVSGWTSPRAYDTNSSQKSSVISLQKGQAYYVEILYQEGGGADHLSLVWQRAGQAREMITADHMQAPPEMP